jgi:fructokinase
MAEVLCVGEALVDRLEPPEGDRLGGAPANVACALARLGTPSAFLGRLGRDPIGEALAALMHSRGVDGSAIQWDAQRPSRIVLVRRDPTGERCFAGFAGDRGLGFADQALDPAELDAGLHRLLKPGWLISGTIPLASPQACRALQGLVPRALAAGLRLGVDVNWRPTFWDPSLSPDAPPSAQALARIRPLIAQAHLLKCTAEEAQWLFNSTDPVAIAAALPHHPDVLITGGNGPIRWSAVGRRGERQAFQIRAVDTTGAGDAFLAGWLHTLCRHPGWTVEQRIAFASACGAIVCGGAGAIDPQPTEPQVLAFLADQRTAY